MERQVYKRATFDETVGVLVKAFMNGTLIGGLCGCAVGNLVADKLGYKIVKLPKLTPFRVSSSTTLLVNSAWENSEGRRFLPKWASIGATEMTILPQALTTGYTFDEIVRIESAFEFRGVAGGTRSRSNIPDPLLFERLMAVVDVLAEIHGKDLTAKEKAKAQFVLS